MKLTKPDSTNSLHRDALSLRQSSLARYDFDAPATRFQMREWVDALARASRTPIAWISFGDRTRHQVLASVGFVRETLEAGAGTVVRAIETHGLLAIDDVCNFELCERAPLVVQAPCGRSFIGMTLRDAKGVAIGTMAAMDVVPRSFAKNQLDVLRAFAQQVVAHLELQSALVSVAQPAAESASS
ncbi:MAG: GAF domain-containing protein, partial [Cyanobacteria bacterium J06648_11]